MSFPDGGSRETPAIYSRISRRNFWPGSKSKWRAPRPLFMTVGDMLWNRIPIRARHRRGPGLPMRRGRWAGLWDSGGDRLAPRPEQHRRKMRGAA
jgi:hypothetical protein